MLALVFQNVEGTKYKGHPTIFGDAIPSDHPYGNTYNRQGLDAGERATGGEEGEEEEEGREPTWKQLPKVYLKLSKSRLTGMIHLLIF